MGAPSLRVFLRKGGIPRKRPTRLLHLILLLGGTVTKIKMLKRQMYGRASFALLRKRVILHPG